LDCGHSGYGPLASFCGNKLPDSIQNLQMLSVPQRRQKSTERFQRWTFTLNMEAARTSEMTLLSYRNTTRRRKPDDLDLHSKVLF